MGWRNRPKFINYCPENIDYILFIDENGSDDLKDIRKAPGKYKAKQEILTMTGVAIKKDNLKIIKDEIVKLKSTYWEGGLFKYKSGIKRVCFHSDEIRKKLGPFSPNIIDYANFTNDLSDTIRSIPMTIFSSSIDKVRHCRRYSYPNHPYSLCLNLIIERFARYYLKNSTAIIVIEAIGKDHDAFTLEHLKDLIDYGDSFITSQELTKIKGVYFNQKWQKGDDKKSYFGLEIADLCSYPIHKFVKHGTKDLAFDCFEDKIYHYPNYLSYGIKIFP